VVVRGRAGQSVVGTPCFGVPSGGKADATLVLSVVQSPDPGFFWFGCALGVCVVVLRVLHRGGTKWLPLSNWNPARLTPAPIPAAAAAVLPLGPAAPGSHAPQTP
jgi:hypothetical protein